MKERFVPLLIGILAVFALAADFTGQPQASAQTTPKTTSPEPSGGGYQRPTNDLFLELSWADCLNEGTPEHRMKQCVYDRYDAYVRGAEKYNGRGNS